MKVLVILSAILIAINASFINPYPRFKRYFDGDDPGEALYLTPLINKGNLSEAREKAKVVGSGLDIIESYAGYLTVEKTKQYESNMFFWYFPSQSNKQYAPIILWLQGGPGATSLFGLFAENGPFQISADGKLEQRLYTWNQNHHLIYIDNPVGTGYSFSTSEAGYSTTEVQIGSNLYEAVKQIFKLFPELHNFDFWVTGESYAGKYVPALAHTIYKNQRKKKVHVPIKLKGIAIGNGFTDPLHQVHYGDYLYEIGLIDLNGKDVFDKYEKEGIDCIKKHNMACAFEKIDELIDGDVHNGSVFKNLTGFQMYFNYLKTKDYIPGDNIGKFLQLSSTRKSIHVGNNTFHDLSEKENLVEKHLKNDFMKSVAQWVAELLDNNYRVCIYNGQLDIIVGYPLTLNYLQKLKFNAADTYKNAPRHIWKVKEKDSNEMEIAGYVKEAGSLVEILVRNAGHMSPADQPRWVLDMITRLTHGKSFY